MNHRLHLPGSTQPRCLYCNKTWIHLEHEVLKSDPAKASCPKAPAFPINPVTVVTCSLWVANQKTKKWLGQV